MPTRVSLAPSRRPLPALRLAATLAAAATLPCVAAGCSDPATAPDRPLLATSPALGSLLVTAEPSARAVGPGESIVVRIRVVNRSAVPITVVGSGTCTVRLEVRDARGDAVEPYRSLACTRDCRAFLFAPGQPYEREARFAARGWSNAEQRQVTLAPGVYRLYGVVDGGLDGCGGPGAQAASAPARVTVGL